MAGVVNSAGAFVEVGGVMHRLPATKTPLREWAEQMAQMELPPCRHCGARWGCDCEDWLEWMAMQNNDAAARAEMECENE